MSRVPNMPYEWKARVGVDAVQVWFPPPDAADLTLAPTFTVHMPTGDVVLVKTAVGAEITITAIGSDRRTLTAQVAPGGSHGGMVGDYAGFALLTDEQSLGTIPVKVARYSGTSVYLADVLPKEATLSGSGTYLRWNAYSVVLPAATVTLEPRRSIRWDATWEAKAGGVIGSVPHAQDGLLHVVRRPFATGISMERLAILVPGLSPQIPRRQESWYPQILEAERWVIRQLRAAKLIEDYATGPEWEQCVAYKAAESILAGQVAVGANRAEARDYYGEQARQECERLLDNQSWYDLDGDGVVDEGETAYSNGPGTAMVSSAFSTTATRRFSASDKL